MPDGSEPRYAAETTAFLRLFQRVGRSLAGLLALQIGWILLVVLASRLASTKLDPPSVQIPWIGAPTEVSLSIAWAWGGLGILAAWSIYSRAYSYVVAPLRVVALPLIAALYVPLVLVLALLDLVFVDPVRWWLKKRWIGNQSPELLEKIGNDAADHIASEKIRLRAGPFLWLLRAFDRVLLTPLHSEARVGFCALGGLPAEGDVVVSEPPANQYGAAVATVLGTLGHLPGMRRVRFLFMPSSLSVSTRQWAVRLRWLFSLDVLVWGRCDPDDPRRAVAWIAARAKPGQADNEHDLDSLFPPVDDPGRPTAPGIRFVRSDALDVHVVLLAATLCALKARLLAPERLWSQFRHPEAEALINEIQAHMAFDALPALRSQTAASGLVPEASTVAASLAEGWVGQMLSDRFGRSGPWAASTTVRFGHQLMRTLDACASLMPQSAPHLYRKGAVACVIDEPDLAVDAFKGAGELERGRDIAGWIDAEVTIASELAFAVRPSSPAEILRLARYAAHIAATLNRYPDPKRVQELRDAFEKATVVRQARRGREKLPTALVVVDKLLLQAGAPPPTPATPAPATHKTAD